MTDFRGTAKFPPRAAEAGEKGGAGGFACAGRILQVPLQSVLAEPVRIITKAPTQSGARMKIQPTPPRKPRAAKMKASDGGTAPEPAVTATPSSTTLLVPWAAVLLVILFAAVVRIRLLEVPLERDEGEYAYAGQLLLQGIPPYREAFNMKFPGVYGAYAVIMAVFGQTIAGIHLGLLLLNAGTIVLVFLLGRRLFSPAAGVAAAAAYAVLSLGAGVLGIEAHATHFVVAAALGATLLLLRATDKGSSAMLFWSGLLYGVAILMKQHGAIFAIFGALYLLVDHVSQQRGSWPVILRKLVLLVLGAAVPLGLTALALWLAGVFGKFWFWTILYAREYATELPFAEGMAFFKFMFPRVVGPNLLLWILAAVGLSTLWWKKRDRRPAIFASAFLLFSFFAVCPGFYFREHYFILLLPAIALLAGATVSSARRITWVLFGTVLGISIAWQSDLLFRSSPLETSRAINGLNPFPEAIQVADYLRTHSDKNSRIAVLGSEPEIYFYANRRSATGYIYTYSMMEAQPFALTMQNEMIGELEKARPEYVVFVDIRTSWSPRPGSQFKIYNWWAAYGPRNYRLAGVADIISADRTEFHWDDVENVAAYRPQSKQIIVIFRRNSK